MQFFDDEYEAFTRTHLKMVEEIKKQSESHGARLATRRLPVSSRQHKLIMNIVIGDKDPEVQVELLKHKLQQSNPRVLNPK